MWKIYLLLTLYLIAKIFCINNIQVFNTSIDN